MNLLVCADPGARAHFVASWLLDDLSKAFYDVGINIGSKFTKLHTDWHNSSAKEFNGVKIRIRPSLSMIDTHLYLFLTKNVYSQIQDFPQNGVDLESVEKMLEFAKECFYHDNQIDHDLYDHVIMFEDTYDCDKMIKLYQVCNQRLPTDKQIAMLEETNILNQVKIDLNHCCSVAAMILRREEELGLPEIDRYWSLKHIYQSTPVEFLYHSVYNSVHPDNYGKSDHHQEGVNSMTKIFTGSMIVKQSQRP